MEEQTNENESYREPLSEPVEKNLALHTVTPLSKYLAMALFIAMPFIGGWVGYHYAPTKVVEIERVVIQEVETPQKDQTTFDEISDWQTYRNEEFGFEFKYPSNWSVFYEDEESVGIGPTEVNSMQGRVMIEIGFNRHEGLSYLEYSGINYSEDSCEETSISSRQAISCFPIKTLAGHQEIFTEGFNGFDSFSIVNHLLDANIDQSIINSINIEIIERDSEEQFLPSNSLENCFSEIPFDQHAVVHSGNKSLAEGFVLWLPDSLALREADETNFEQGEYIIESSLGHKASVNFVTLNSEILHSRKMHSPSVVFEPKSNTWWFNSFFNRQPEECLPNSTGVTKSGDSIYLTQDGDVGAFFKTFTLVSTERLKKPVAGYADVVQIELSGNVNDQNHQSYEAFEALILEMLYNTEAAITKG